MKKLTFYLTLSLTTILFFTQCSSDAKVNAFLELQAKAVNLQCPMSIDNMTTLDKCEVPGHRTFRYIYTIKGDISSIDTLQIKEVLKPNIVERLKTLPEIQKFRDFEVNVEYVYNDSKGAKFFQMNIAPEEYK